MEGGLDDSRVIALAEHHAATARSATPSGNGHSFSASRLRAADIRFFSAWDDDEVVGIGAFKALCPDHGEVKSMHTADAARRRGIGLAILDRIEVAARCDGLRRLSLETHPGAHFLAAVALYRRCGFVECGPFGDHVADPSSIFMTKELN